MCENQCLRGKQFRKKCMKTFLGDILLVLTISSEATRSS